jgi:hypothetical protein
MQPLDTYGLIVNFFVVIMMPLIIWGNLRKNARSTPFNDYLWTEHRTFMRVSMLVIGVLTLFSAVSLLGHYGVVSGEFVDVANLVIGIPFLVLAVVEIVLAVRVALKYMRDRKAGTSKI